MTFFEDSSKKMSHDDVFHFQNEKHYIKDRCQILSKIKDFVAWFFAKRWISSEMLKKSWHELSRGASFCFKFQRFCGMNCVRAWRVQIILIRFRESWACWLCVNERFRWSPQPEITTYSAIMRRKNWFSSRYVSNHVVFCSQLPSTAQGEAIHPFPALKWTCCPRRSTPKPR